MRISDWSSDVCSSDLLGVSKLAELDGASICVSAGTTTELNLADYFRTHSLGYTPIVANSREQNLANLESGRCDAYTNERGGLAASRLGLGQPAEYIILPEIISKKPLGPIVRQKRSDERGVGEECGG